MGRREELRTRHYKKLRCRSHVFILICLGGGGGGGGLERDWIPHCEVELTCEKRKKDGDLLVRIKCFECNRLVVEGHH